MNDVIPVYGIDVNMGPMGTFTRNRVDDTIDGDKKGQITVQDVRLGTKSKGNVLVDKVDIEDGVYIIRVFRSI